MEPNSRGRRIGEFVGLAAVVGSLVFVGLQVRQAAQATCGATQQQLSAAGIEVNTISTDADIAALITRNREADWSTLDPVDRTRLTAYFPYVVPLLRGRPVSVQAGQPRSRTQGGVEGRADLHGRVWRGSRLLVAGSNEVQCAVPRAGGQPDRGSVTRSIASVIPHSARHSCRPIRRTASSFAPGSSSSLALAIVAGAVTVAYALRPTPLAVP